MLIGRPARSLTAGAVLLASLNLAGCGEDTEQFCAAVDDLQASVADVTEVELNQDALTTVQDNLGQVRTDWDVVKDEASDEFADELDAVDKAAASAGLAIDFALTSPSPETAADVGPALELLGARLEDLNQAVQSTC